MTRLPVADVPVRCGRPCDHAARVTAVCFACLEVRQFRFIDRVVDFPVMIQRPVRTVPYCAGDRVRFTGAVLGHGRVHARLVVQPVETLQVPCLDRLFVPDVQRQVLGMVQAVQKRRVAAAAVFRLSSTFVLWCRGKPGVNVAMMRSSGV